MRLDLEVGLSVAIHIPLDRDERAVFDEMELARPVVEGLLANEVEVLIAAGQRVRVNVVEIDLVAFDMAEVKNLVALSADAAVG